MNSLTSQEKDFIKHSLNQESFAVEKLAGDVSTRHYFRITLKKNIDPSLSLRKPLCHPGNAKHYPGSRNLDSRLRVNDIFSYVLMKAEPNTLPLFIEIAGFLKKGGLSVPEVFKSHKALGLLLLEYGGNTLLESIAKK